MILVKVEEPSVQSFLSLVNFNHKWKEMLKEPELDFISPEIEPQYFKEMYRGQGKQLTEIRTVHFNRPVSLKNLRHILGEMNLRSATFPELLSLANWFRDLQREFPIAAAGTFWKNRHGDYGIPYLWCHLGKRTLCLNKVTDFERYFRAFQPFCRFAAVPLSLKTSLIRSAN